MHSPFTLLFTFILLLSLAHGAALPLSPSESQFDAQASTDITPNVQPREYIHTGINLCVNSNIGNQCQLATYFRKVSPVGVELYMFDHDCIRIGYNPNVSYDAMKNWFGFNSQLPKVAVVYMDVDSKTWGGPSMPFFWYNGTLYNWAGRKYDPSKFSCATDAYGGIGCRMTFQC